MKILISLSSTINLVSLQRLVTQAARAVLSKENSSYIVVDHDDLADPSKGAFGLISDDTIDFNPSEKTLRAIVNELKKSIPDLKIVTVDNFVGKSDSSVRLGIYSPRFKV